METTEIIISRIFLYFLALAVFMLLIIFNQISFTIFKKNQ